MITDILTKLPPEVQDRLPRQVVGVGDRVHSSEGVTYAFDQNRIDCFFPIVLCFQTHGGSEIGEPFVVASRIDETDPDTCETRWKRMAERVERRAEDCRTAGALRECAERTSPAGAAPWSVRSGKPLSRRSTASPSTTEST